MLALALVAVIARVYIRCFIQRQIGIDDGFLLFAVCALITSFVIMYTVTVDDMYLAEAVTLHVEGVVLPPDLLPRLFDFRKWSTVILMLAWSAIVSVKLAFMFFFRNLIDRLRHLQRYWWVVLVFNIGVAGYGIAVYYVSCPYYYDTRARKSTVHSPQSTVHHHSANTPQFHVIVATA